MKNTAEMHLPGHVSWGAGALDRIVPFVRGQYKRAAVCTDRGVRSAGLLEDVLGRLEEADAAAEVLPDIPPEPTAQQAQEILDAFAGSGADLIVAVGGGSVMDVAKLASAADGHPVRALVQDPALARKGTAMLAVPTTAGTGAEATPNAIVALPEQGLKVGIVSAAMLPDAVVLDPAMTRTLPKAVAASTGVDALCHAIECTTSRKATPMSDLFALEALRLIFPNILPACETGDGDARAAMLLASFYAGAAIACSGTTAVHALSYPLGGRYHIPHGVANAMLLAPVMRFNATSCTAELARVHDAVGLGGGAADETGKAARVVAELDSIVTALEIPRSLAPYGVAERDLDGLVESGMAVTRLLVNNKRDLAPEDARALYRAIL